MAPRFCTFLRSLSFKTCFLSLIIFFSATQLGLHFWPASALLFGLRLDYLSPTLYFLDLLLLLYLLLFSRPRFSAAFFNRRLYFLYPLLLVNLLFSLNPLATLSWSLHLVLYLAFLFSLPPSSLSRPLTVFLPLTLFFQLVLAVLQVLSGHSLQGLFYFLGERSLSLTSPNVAKGEFIGQVVLRAYGTFSHPNILAGWSVVALLILIYLVRSRLSRRSSPFPALLLPTILTVILVLLADSRAAALSLFGIVIPFFLLRSRLPRLIYFFLILGAGSWLSTTGLLTQRLGLSISERLVLQNLSLSTLLNWPLFGTGASASLSAYPLLAPLFRLFQPDHNSLTLFLSWFGVLGALAFLSFFARVHRPFSQLYLLLPLLPLLLLDHYLLTSPQGLFILLLYLKVAYFAKLNTYANS